MAITTTFTSLLYMISPIFSAVAPYFDLRLLASAIWEWCQKNSISSWWFVHPQSQIFSFTLLSGNIEWYILLEQVQNIRARWPSAELYVLCSGTRETRGVATCTLQFRLSWTWVDCKESSPNYKCIKVNNTAPSACFVWCFAEAARANL